MSENIFLKAKTESEPCSKAAYIDSVMEEGWFIKVINKEIEEEIAGDIIFKASLYNPPDCNCRIVVIFSAATAAAAFPLVLNEDPSKSGPYSSIPIETIANLARFLEAKA